MSEVYPSFLNRLDTIIAENLQDEDFSIDTLCKELSISYSHTYRKVRQVTGVTPSRYICKKRLDFACELLKRTDLTISEISYRVGFNTQAYFSKCFSEAYGCPPLQFRKRLKENKK